MMRTLGFAAFWAVGMGIGRQSVMRAAHVAARRRGFSFWHRHGGFSPKKRNPENGFP
jgi:hypothetical protein